MALLHIMEKRINKKNNQLALIKSIPVVEYRLSGEGTFEFCPPKEGAK